MKIAYLVGEFPRLSETFVIGEIKEHRRNGVDLSVISMFKPQDASQLIPDIEGTPVLYVYRTTGRRLRLEQYWFALLALLTRWRLWRVPLGAGFGSRTDRLNILGLAYRLKKTGGLAGADLLHCHFGTRAHLAAALRSLGLIDTNIVTTFHGFDISATIRRKGPDHYRLLFRFGTLFLPISELWAQKLRELGCDPKRIRVHHMGINCALTEFRERRRDSRPMRPVKLVSIGRLVEKKGHAHTLRALARMRRHRPDIVATLEIVGGGDLEDALKKEALALGLTDAVTFHGGLPHADTLRILNEAAIFVLPSVTSKGGDMEGIPVSLMEAMARGLPVISTYHSGIPELVQDGVCGFLVPEGDDESLARAIERMIDSAPQWPEIGRAGRLIVEKSFDRQRLGHRLLDYYREVSLARTQ